MLASLLRRSHTTRHCAHHQFQNFFYFIFLKRRREEWLELSNSTVTCNTTKTHIHLHKSVLHFTVTHNLQQDNEHKIDVKFKKRKKKKVFIVTQSSH